MHTMQHYIDGEWVTSQGSTVIEVFDSNTAEAASVIVQIANPTASGRKFTRPCQRRPRG